MPNSPAIAPPGLHLAIIMDGNGRWASARGRPRAAGHVVGARKAREMVEIASHHGIGTMTLYAFSADNWARPRREVVTLMRLFRRTILAEQERCIATGVRLIFIGRRDRIPRELLHTIESAEAATAGGRRLLLRVALDYGARDTIERVIAMARLTQGEITRETVAEMIGRCDHSGGPAPDVDLLVRTGGEQRLSDFLLWECAYAELIFTRRMWPDFGEEDLVQALKDFHSRHRRFGAIDEPAEGQARTA